MASQQYSLRWNNYVRHMTSAFESLRSDKDLIDVTLSCEGKKIPAHKMLLSACSSYFKDLFKENPCQHPVIIFRNVTFVDLMALVDFMYNGEVNVEQEQLASFLNTAELLQVQGLTNSSKDQEKIRKTAKEDDRVPGSSSQFDEDGEERTATPTRTGPPAKKRKWQSPSRTESPAAVLESQTVQASSGVDEDVQPIDQVPLKTETPDYDDEDDVQAESGADDTTDEQDIVQKLQKSDQLVLTTNRNRTSNNEHSLFGNNSMDMDSGDMSSFGMAGPSNESMGQDGMQDLSTQCEDYSEDFANNSAGQNWQIGNCFSIPIDEFRNVVRHRGVVTILDPTYYTVNSCNNVDHVFTEADFTDQRLISAKTRPQKFIDNNDEFEWPVECELSEKMQPVVDLGVPIPLDKNYSSTCGNKYFGSESERRLPRIKSTWRVQGVAPVKVEVKKSGSKPKEENSISLSNCTKTKPGPNQGAIVRVPEQTVKKPGTKGVLKLKKNSGSDVKKKQASIETKRKGKMRKPSKQNTKAPKPKKGKDGLWVIERNGQFVCSQCARTFPNKTRCLTHQHKHRMTFFCRKCNRCYISKPQLMRHKLLNHSKTTK